MFLYGFPEYWYGWHKQLHYFAARGYHAMAPDQRGYNRSSKPEAIKDYTLEKLAGDMVELIRKLGSDKVVLVGHDWGGVVAWTVAMQFPHLLRKLVILNMPHPAVLLKNLSRNPRQMLRSWYTAAFQVPVLPELAASALDYSLLVRSMIGSAKPGTFSEADRAAYKEAWQQPGALSSMFKWYRAFKHTQLDLRKTVEVPTLLIWGKKDFALGAEMAEPSIARCTAGQLVFLEEATHWLQHEQPEVVNEKIRTFLAS